jgi:hypothetical protein
MTLRDKFQQWFINDVEEHYEGTVEEVAIEHEKVADEFAIGFAFYLSDNYTSRTLDTWDDAVGIRFTTKELLEIYKKEKGL